MRSIWKGSISFGLVTIPVALYPAVQREELKFRFLRKSDLSPVNYKRVAEVDGKEVPWEEIVKGYEYEKGKFVVLKEEDFQRADVEAVQSIDILDFVSLKEVDPMYFYKPYYVEPQKGGEKSYILLHQALLQTGKAGIAKVVIRVRQHLSALRADREALVLELMHFGDELLGTDQLHVPKKKEVRKRELEMAKDLVENMTEKWDPHRYTDDYKSALMKLIEEKVESGEPKGLPTPRRPHPTNVVDLFTVLKKSLEQEKRLSKKTTSTRRRVRRSKAKTSRR